MENNWPEIPNIWDNRRDQSSSIHLVYRMCTFKKIIAMLILVCFSACKVLKKIIKLILK